MEWQRYERAVVEQFVRQFRSPNFHVEPAGEEVCRFRGKLSRTDRQLDVAVFRRDEPDPFLVVDAKHWRWPLDVTDVEAFMGLVEDVGAQLGVLVASSNFSTAATTRAGAASARPIKLIVLSVDEALSYEWLRAARLLFPWDWAFHEQLGEALRMIEMAHEPSSIAEVLDPVAFEEWERFVAHSLHRHRPEAEAFLRWIARHHHDDGWRFNAIARLDEHGMLDEVLRRELLTCETDDETRQLLAKAGGYR